MSYLSFCNSVFGFIGRRYRNDKELGKTLNQAHMEMTPDAYVSWALMTVFLSILVLFVVQISLLVVLISVFPSGSDASASEAVLILIIGLILIGSSFVQGILPIYFKQITVDDLVVYLLGMGFGFLQYGPNFMGLIAFASYLVWTIFKYIFQIKVDWGIIKGNFAAMKAKHRGSIADLYLPHAAAFVSAMSSSNATMDTIFYALATQKAKKIGADYHVSKLFGMEVDRDVFPIISEESAAIYRDMTLLGVDTLSAIQSAVERAPSPWLAEFFQGISSTISSGGNLKLYFLNSAERFMDDIKQQQKEALEQLATQAEMFVTVAVAMPIFLIIILIITVWVSTSGSSTGDSLSTLYLVVFGLVPLLHFMFAIMTYLNIKKFQI